MALPDDGGVASNNETSRLKVFDLKNRQERGRGVSVKVYLVLLPLNTAKQGDPNIAIMDAKLSKRKAQEVVDQMPGAFIAKVIANKE